MPACVHFWVQTGGSERGLRRIEADSAERAAQTETDAAGQGRAETEKAEGPYESAALTT